MPSNVQRFEQLMYVSLMLGIVMVAIDNRPDMVENRTFMITVVIFVTAFTILFTWLIARRGANWARWLMTVLFVLGLPIWLWSVMVIFQEDTISGVISLTQFVVQAIAYVLIFSGDARDWFSRRAA